MRLYRGLYGMIGSYELMRLKWDFDIASYHNLWVAPFMTDLHLDEGWLRRQLRLRNLVLRAMENFAALFGRVEETLREQGDYYRRNRGVFSYGLENIDFLPQIGLPRSQQRDARAGRAHVQPRAPRRARAARRGCGRRLAAAVVRDALACLTATTRPSRRASSRRPRS